ncbi:hypothetical protein S7711_02262 [Stachybotrys chartarum IBT 7711]|uniref:Manganese/iron superoxide dismutase C-terminal domain-containing protein n=2 Tax=Stachybotrys TaxID=74721 RepID=A0A084AZD3_STACB|nr:hypothetical protein S7711_02262 [Stachybotrys chartarum IBT 7711]
MPGGLVAVLFPGQLQVPTAQCISGWQPPSASEALSLKKVPGRKPTRTESSKRQEFAWADPEPSPPSQRQHHKAMLRTSLRIPRQVLGAGLRVAACPGASRHLHHVPSLTHSYPDGVPNLLSAGGFNIAWTDYMTLMTEKLNALTVGTELEDKSTKTIALMTAREPSQAPIFNYASMAHNNHFFFEGFSPTGTPMPDTLRSELEANFSSIETLRREFIITASAMFGPGFVWLVRTNATNEFRILTTYLAGSPYSGAHWRAQPTDMNTRGNEGSAKSYFANQAAAASARGPAANLPPGGIDVSPVLCLNTWEHVWLLDWGVGAGGAGGKMAYAESWWELIDWEKVAEKAGVLRPKLKTADRAPAAADRA